MDGSKSWGGQGRLEISNEDASQTERSGAEGEAAIPDKGQVWDLEA